MWGLLGYSFPLLKINNSVGVLEKNQRISKIRDFTTDLTTEIFFLLPSYDLHVFIT